MSSNVRSAQCEKTSPTDAEVNHIVRLFDNYLFAEVAKLGRELIKKYPECSLGWKFVAAALYKLDRLNESLEYGIKAASLKEDDAEVHYNTSVVALELGNTSSAMTHIKQALNVKPDYIGAHRHFSLFHKYYLGDPYLQILEDLKKQPIHTLEESVLLFSSLAKAYEDVSDYHKSFSSLVKANNFQRQLTGYNISTDLRLFDKIEAEDSAIPLYELKAPKSSVIPIFIVGMPRSGTTLVNQIITNNEHVTSGGELLYFGEAFNKFVANKPITLQSLKQVRSYYLKKIQKIANGRRYVTDKMPTNFFFVGLIKRAIPESIVIHVHRDPIDVCWSNYKTIFKTGNLKYSNDLLDIVAYYRRYRELTSLFRSRYPDFVHDLSYEALVNNLKLTATLLYERLGLEWKNEYLDYTKNKQPVRTASMSQVRKNTYNSSGQWRNFEQFLKAPFSGLLKM